MNLVAITISPWPTERGSIMSGHCLDIGKSHCNATDVVDQIASIVFNFFEFCA